MRITMDEDERSECDWLHGLCHCHALASVRRHGGSFVVVTDNDGMNPDDVLHVLSVHAAGGHGIVRDVAGEAYLDDLYDYVNRLFPGRFGDLIETDEAGIARLIREGRLVPETEAVRRETEALESVTRDPGILLEDDGPCP